MNGESAAARPTGLVLSSIALLLFIGCCAFAEQEPEVPVVDGHLGSCAASFTVTDAGKKPIYDAKIDVIVHYGFLGLHKMELQVGTNSDGKARIAGLPDKIKKPLEFYITSGSLSETVTAKAPMKCDAGYEVVLGKK